MIERGKREAEEARREISGDPAEAFNRMVRECFALESLQVIFLEMIGEEPSDQDANGGSSVDLQEKPMAIPRRSDEMPPNLARFLERAKRETEEARRQIGGDPREALYEIVRKNYDYESFRRYFEEIEEGGPGWLDNDDVDK